VEKRAERAMTARLRGRDEKSPVALATVRDVLAVKAADAARQ